TSSSSTLGWSSALLSLISACTLVCASFALASSSEKNLSSLPSILWSENIVPYFSHKLMKNARTKWDAKPEQPGQREQNRPCFPTAFTFHVPRFTFHVFTCHPTLVAIRFRAWFWNSPR